MNDSLHLLDCTAASGRNWVEGEHYQIRHTNTSILKKFLDVTKLVIGNKVASFTNLYQCLQELSICISYMALKGINTPSLYIDQQKTRTNILPSLSLV